MVKKKEGKKCHDRVQSFEMEARFAKNLQRREEEVSQGKKKRGTTW